MILALISLSHIAGATGQYSINTLAPFYLHDLELTRTQVGLFFTAFYAGMACLSYPAGWLADRLGVGKAALVGHVSLGIFTVAAAWAPSFAWAFGCFLFAGLGYSFLNPASTKGVMGWFEARERATAMGIKQTGVPAGGVLTAMLAPSLVLWMGWRGALAVLGVLNTLCGFVFWGCWREGPVGSEQPFEVGASGTLDIDRSPFTKLCAISLGTAVLLTAQMALLTYLPLYLKDVMAFSPFWASQALALAQMGGMVGRVGWGVISDRLCGGERKGVLVGIGIGSVALLALLGFVAPSASPALLFALIFFSGVCMIGYQGVSYALIGEVAGSARTGAALGIVISVNSLGAILGTPLFGYLVDKTDSYAIAWGALAAIVLSGVLALKFFLAEATPSGASSQPTTS